MTDVATHYQYATSKGRLVSMRRNTNQKQLREKKAEEGEVKIGAELGIEVVYWRLRARTLKEKKRRLSITESATKRRHRFDTALQHCSSPLLTPTTGSATRSHMWSKMEARVLHL